MKKILIPSLIAIFLLLTFVSCGGKNECETCSYGEWTVVTEATCTEGGTNKRVCTVCGKEETVATDPLSHEFGEWETITEATCTEAGSRKHTCNKCGVEETEATELKAHTFGELSAVEGSTCNRQHTCTVCQYVEILEGEQAEHTYGEWETVAEATCAEAGSRKRVCTACAYESVEEIAKLAHTFGEWETTTAASCASAGEQKRTCTVCGHEETSSIAALSHRYSTWTIEKEPNCSEKGIKTRTCTRCEAKDSAEIDMNNSHTFGDWVTDVEPTYTEDGSHTRTCINGCGETETEVMPKKDSLCTLTLNLGDGHTEQYYVPATGEYSLSDPVRFGYTFAGWADASGNAFPKSGTVTSAQTITAKWNVKPTTTFDELKTRIEANVKDIHITNDIVLTETIYVMDNITITATAQSTLKRSPEFLGDLFVIGMNAAGDSVILEGRTASVSLRADDGSKLKIDGNKNNMNATVVGTAFLIVNSSGLNIYDNVEIVNCKKVANERISEENDFSFSNPTATGGAAIIIGDGAYCNMNGGLIANNEVSLDAEDKTSSYGGAVINLGTFKMTGGVIEGNKAARGGAVYNIRTAYIYGGTIKDNSAAVYGGAMYLSDSQYSYAVFGLEDDESDVILTNNTSGKSGGAIFTNHQSTVIAYEGTVFSNNTSTNGNGGAINVAGEMVLANVIFENNAAHSKGGAIYAYYNKADLSVRHVRISNCTFTGNKAERGGAISTGNGDEVESEGANVIINDSAFTGNSASLREDGSGYGFGGAIHVDGGSYVELNRVVIKQNIAGVKGGAVYATKASDVVVNASEISENTSCGNGGAFYMYTNSKLTISDSTIKDNVGNLAEYGGGAIYLTGAKATLSNVTISGNKAYNGGGIAAYTSSEVTINKATFSENEALYQGGAVYANDSSVKLEKADGTEDDVIVFEQNKAARGGALYVTGATVTGYRLVMTENSATALAGAVYVTSGTEFTVTDLIMTGNTVSGEFESDALVDDTGMGGAMCVYSADTIVKINGLVANGNVSYANGGFLYASKADITIQKSENTGVTISNNVSTAEKGGAIAIHSNGKVTLYDATFSGNKAEKGNGGALYVYGGRVVLGDAEHTAPITFTGNVSKGGGAIYIAPTKSNNSYVEAYAITANNNSSNSGGAIYVGHPTKDTASEYMTATLDVAKLTVNGNTSTENGGALYIYYNAVVNVTDELTASGNTATKYGGAAYISGAAVATFESATVNDNTADQGGGFYITTTDTTVTINGGDITGNSATTKGTDVWVNTKKSILKIKKSSTTYDAGNIQGASGFEITEI